MFFSSDSNLEMKINIFFSVIFLLVSLSVLLFRKRIFLSVVIFSVFENLLMIFNLYTKSVLFVGVPIIINYLIVFAWPLLNIFLIYKYFSSKKNEASSENTDFSFGFSFYAFSLQSE